MPRLCISWDMTMGDLPKLNAESSHFWVLIVARDTRLLGKTVELSHGAKILCKYLGTHETIHLESWKSVGWRAHIEDILNVLTALIALYCTLLSVPRVKVMGRSRARWSKYSQSLLRTWTIYTGCNWCNWCNYLNRSQPDFVSRPRVISDLHSSVLFWMMSACWQAWSTKLLETRWTWCLPASSRQRAWWWNSWWRKRSARRDTGPSREAGQDIPIHRCQRPQSGRMIAKDVPECDLIFQESQRTLRVSRKIYERLPCIYKMIRNDKNIQV